MSDPQAQNAVPVRTPAEAEREELLRHIAALTASVNTLAQRALPPAIGEADTSTRSQAEADQATVLFAYNFLGEVLGRQDFNVPRVAVSRGSKTLTFTELRGGAFALVRAANNQVDNLDNLVVNQPFALTIPDSQAIDAIVMFDRAGGVPVAIGECPGPPDDSQVK